MDHKQKTECAYCKKHYVNIDRHKCRVYREKLEKEAEQNRIDKENKLDNELSELSNNYPMIVDLIKRMQDQIYYLEREINNDDFEWI